MNREAEINKELIKVLKDKIQLLEEQKSNSQEIINAQKEQLILSSVSKSKSIALADLIKENERAIEGFDSLKKKYPKMETQDVIDLLKRQLPLLKELQ